MGMCLSGFHGECSPDGAASFAVISQKAAALRGIIGLFPENDRRAK